MGIEIFLIAVVWFFFQLEDVASWVCTNLSLILRLYALWAVGVKYCCLRTAAFYCPFEQTQVTKEREEVGWDLFVGPEIP